ncbi:hypothetical protein RGQ30_30740 [Limnobacter thiooxidans]|uniref:Uncharacterized protein n=1 Tax=Limnobacter thiooxidans TaxID=131080 RepID=A0AA86J1Z3_9BURK|nr:hypothetical protein RGQ30_30740 [Limnobacter thiooxidans]
MLALSGSEAASQPQPSPKGMLDTEAPMACARDSLLSTLVALEGVADAVLEVSSDEQDARNAKATPAMTTCESFTHVSRFLVIFLLINLD